MDARRHAFVLVTGGGEQEGLSLTDIGAAIDENLRTERHVWHSCHPPCRCYVSAEGRVLGKIENKVTEERRVKIRGRFFDVLVEYVRIITVIEGKCLVP